ncbi:MAG: hypothetical protein MRZ66_01575 [Clostridiales bacterium]|nr:hypothetical protein [Clostridiales bacterium]
MYTIIMRDDKSLIPTETEPIYQYESNTSTIRLLVPQTIADNPMQEFTCVFKYELPDGTKCCDCPVKQSELYSDFLDYRLLVTSRLTKNEGEIKGYLSFLKVVEDTSTGSKKPFIIHSSSISIPIHKKKDIFTYSSDPNLQAIDNQILKLQELVNVVTTYNSILESTKADDIELIDGELWLTANGEKIGDPIPYTSSDEITDVAVRRVLENTVLDSGGGLDNNTDEKTITVFSSGGAI